jgi:hypothetical protein
MERLPLNVFWTTPKFALPYFLRGNNQRQRNGNRFRNYSGKGNTPFETQEMYPLGTASTKICNRHTENWRTKTIHTGLCLEEQKQFLGLWPSEHNLVKWIQQWWKPKGHYDLQLGSKCFFTIILHNLEDWNHIFDEEPYFFNLAGLFLHFWMEKFSHEKRNFLMHDYGFVYIPWHISYGSKKSLQA